MDSIPSQGTKVSHAVGQFSPHTTTMDPTRSGAWESQLEKPMLLNKKSHMLQKKTQHTQNKIEKI